MRHLIKGASCLAALTALMCAPLNAQQSASPPLEHTDDASPPRTQSIADLRAQFASPPAAARPWTWFHVMSGNMSREGITRDLESLAEVGVGGIVLFHVTQGISHGTVRFNSPEHRELITHTAAECERLGLAFLFHNSDGWSSSGGPWVTPEHSMMRLVWSETLVSGGAISADLPQPPTREDFYRDLAVIAYPSLASELADAELAPVITASDPAFDTSMVSDGDPNVIAELIVPEGEEGYVQFDYESPVAIRSLFLANSPTRELNASLHISDDGIIWREVHVFRKLRVGKFEWILDEAFEPVTARHFRIVADSSFTFGELTLSTMPRIPKLTLHTSLAQGAGTQLPETLDSAAETLIDPSQIIDLTDQLAQDGSLNARLPDGDWTIMRFGYTSTGATNVIASPEGTGLEVDKFSPEAFMAFYRGFIGPVIEEAREVAPNALTGAMIDSYEVGGQNWSPGYETWFADHFGQSIIPWLPAYAGRLVSSPEETRQMLAGIRSFNADLMRDNYYGTFARIMAEQGLESPIQPYGMAPTDDVDVGSRSSIPTGEFWVGREVAQLNDAVSAGRLYGQEVIAAEAFTSFDSINWHFTPSMAKKWGDRAWIAGINQFMFHRFAHQANTHVMPGMTMNRYGSHFDRTQPWWDDGGAAWFAYMARGNHMLRQGQAVTDIAFYVGQDTPVACPERTNFLDRIPEGTEFDCLNEETFFERSEFVDGALQLSNGRRYPVIWWPQNRAPAPAELARLEAARAAGVTVAFAHLGEDVSAMYNAAGLSPRITSTGDLPRFTHRQIGETDIFFLLNFEEEAVDYDLAFTASGNAPELWDPATGSISPLASTIDAAGQTLVRLTLEAGQSTFLVFNPANGMVAPTMPTPTPAIALAFHQPWSLTFDPLYSDAPAMELPALIDLREVDDPEVRHFSGKATYRNSFSWVPSEHADNRRIMLDLGQVEAVASVRLNGVDMGTVWAQPFTLDITQALLSGENHIEIEVATTWVNRLIGDAALENTSGYEPEGRWPERNMVDWYSANEPPPAGPRRTWSTQDFFTAEDPLVPTGLIGPLTLRIEQ